MALRFTPGYYAKVRIDDEGNIVDVADLEAIDLPLHTHKFADILEEDVLEEKISSILSTFFVNTGSNAVVFSYDKKTRTISADVNIDEETIVKNEYGQLAFGGEALLGGSLPSTDSSSQDSKEDVTDTVINTTIVTQGGGNCANHAHTVSQLEDFEQAVKDIVEDLNKNLSVDVNSIADGVTVKVNKFGQLTAVATALEVHQHKLEDIIGLELLEPAAKQMLNTLGEDVDLTNGVFNLSNLNIGYAILAINAYLKDSVEKRIADVKNEIKEVKKEKDNNGVCELKVSERSLHRELLDTRTGKIQDVYFKDTLVLTLNHLPYSKGSITLWKNDSPLPQTRVHIGDLSYLGAEKGIFKVCRLSSKLNYTATILEVDVSQYATPDGVDTFHLQFIVDGLIDNTNTVTVTNTARSNIEYVFEDVTASHYIKGIRYYNRSAPLTYKIHVQDYPEIRYVPSIPGFVNGEYISTSTGNAQITLPNLFEETKIDLQFNCEVEYSESLWLNNMQLINGVVINDVIESSTEEAYTVAIRIPWSSDKNSLAIAYNGLLNRDDIALQKSVDLKIKGNAEAIDGKAGYLELTNGQRILTLGDSYDPGRSDLQLVVNSTLPLDLKKLKMTAIDLF